MYCDAHIHLLPFLDNGPQTLDESLAVLDLLRATKTRRVIITPHYDADREPLPLFLSRVQDSEHAFRSAASLSHFRYLISAEVAITPGISHEPKLEKLLIPGTRLLPITLPLGKLDGFVMRELSFMMHKRKIHPIICHTERHFLLYGKEDYERLLSLPYTTFLFSTPALGDKQIFAEVLRLYTRGLPIVVGSNAHNAISRPPENEAMRSAIADHHGERLYHKLCLVTNAFFDKAFSI